MKTQLHPCLLTSLTLSLISSSIFRRLAVIIYLISCCLSPTDPLMIDSSIDSKKSWNTPWHVSYHSQLCLGCFSHFLVTFFWPYWTYSPNICSVIVTCRGHTHSHLMTSPLTRQSQHLPHSSSSIQAYFTPLNTRSHAPSYTLLVTFTGHESLILTLG